MSGPKLQFPQKLFLGTFENKILNVFAEFWKTEEQLDISKISFR